MSSLPGNNSKSPFTPPFTMPAPLKFTAVYCGGPGRFGRAWWIPDVRQPIVFALFRGGEYGGAVEAARTAPIAVAVGAQPRPMQVRIQPSSRPALSTGPCSVARHVNVISPTLPGRSCCRT